jgi:uncharacterized protein
MWKDIALYIMEHCSPSDKVVEVGVGKFHLVASTLQDYSDLDIVLTDIKPSHSTVVKDDITQPDLRIYEEARFIYAIRPPSELHQDLMNLAENVGATLIVKPLTNEDIATNKRMRLVNYKKAAFYIYP